MGDFVRAAAPNPMRPTPIPGVAHVVAVASAKGGVGKSTVAANLAVALARRGRRVGLLDADIHGPSLPLLMGIPWTTRPDTDPDTGQIIPLVAHGVSCMSVGNLVPPEKAALWRGAMVASALRTLVRRVDWSHHGIGGHDHDDGKGPEKIEVLVVDTPPGTGDSLLTLAQTVALAGAVVVTTPQELALADARRGVEALGQVKVPVLGLVENMCHFVCGECGARAPVFGVGGRGAQAAAEMGVPLLGEIPLRVDISAETQGGRPGGSEAGREAFAALAEKVEGVLGRGMG